MTSTPPELASIDAEHADERRGLVALALLSLIAGAASGLVGACFRRLLEAGDGLRNSIIDWSHERGMLGVAIVVALTAAAAGLAAWLVRRFSPVASGSGIPHVEAVLRGKASPAHYILIPVKFVGGLLAIGAGLALGREGPTVQMGASVAHAVGSLFRLTAADARILLAAGAGAGLATAFNSPIAGSVFVLEELMRRFDTRITIATLGASAAAIGIARVMLGVEPDFPIESISYPALGSLSLYLAFGLVVGLLGIAYNWVILSSLDVAERLKGVPVAVRAGAVGAAVGLLSWYMPQWVGGGDNITEKVLRGEVALAMLPAMFALRFMLGAVSYAAGTPGGLFAPMLVLGAQAGLFFGAFTARWVPQLASDPTSFAVTGMAAFFTATVRAPVTGIILVIELTASDTQLLAMLAACFTAMLVPTLAGNRPIYDSLGERT